MGVTIVVGGQFGGEGKGKVVYELGRSMEIDIGVKVGGTNCGHTVMIDHSPVILRQLPTTALLNDSISIIAAGSYIDLDLLMDYRKLFRAESKTALGMLADFVFDTENIGKIDVEEIVSKTYEHLKVMHEMNHDYDYDEANK